MYMFSRKHFQEIMRCGLPVDEVRDLDIIAGGFIKGKNETWEDFSVSKTLATLELIAKTGRSSTILTPVQILGDEQHERFSSCKDHVILHLRKIGLFVQDGDFDEEMCQGIVGIYVSW